MHRLKNQRKTPLDAQSIEKSANTLKKIVKYLKKAVKNKNSTKESEDIDTLMNEVSKRLPSLSSVIFDIIALNNVISRNANTDRTSVINLSKYYK